MPLFELFGDSSRRKLDSSQEKTTDPSLMPESDFAELIWENGQLMMQGGQSSRGRKNPSLPSYYNSNSPSQSPKHSRDRGDAVVIASNNGDGNGNGNGNGISSSSGRFRTFGSGPNEYPAEICDDDGEDDIVPWFNCPINDFLPDLSGITDNFDSLKKKKNNESNFHPCANEGVSQVPFPSHGPKGSEATVSGMTSTTSNAALGDTNRFPNSGNFVNFSHFSRPKSVNRSTACNNSVIPDSGPSDMERVVFSSKQEGPSAEMKHTNGSKSMEANRTDQPPCSNNSEGISPKDVLNINGIRNENGGAGTSRDPQETVVASSVCSGNGLDGASDDPICNLKRKSRDTYDSEAPSDDIGEDSVGLRKAGSARGNSSKRGRAAEVHNLSERRRRDRINEKMRALQELIPNCNKVDKASMLDEAIEYLKTLQIQVQIMSMGAGMYMPPMMFPGGMQHMHPAHMAQIQAMGVGMASGLGFRMGMGEPNSGMGSSGFPMMQIPPPPPMQGTHFPSPYMSGHPAMHGAVVGPNYPVIGIPGSMSMQRPPMIPFVQRPGSGIQNNGSMDGAVAATTTTGSKEPMAIADGAVGYSTNLAPSQGEARNGGGLEQSPSVQFSRNPGDDSSS